MLKRLFFLILFLIFLPLMIPFYLIKGIIKSVQYNKWKKDGEMGKSLLLNSDITKVDIMQGYEFEEFLRALFFYAGYSAEVTQKSKDFGADLVLEKNNQKIVVQAKRYSKTVGCKSVQEIFSAKEHYLATDCAVVTNSFFSSQAEQLAKELGVQLIDRDELVQMHSQVVKTLTQIEDDFEENMDFYNNPNKCAI